jgi:hypothetical protein
MINRTFAEGVEIQSVFKKNKIKTDFTFYIIHPSEEYKINMRKWV